MLWAYPRTHQSPIDRELDKLLAEYQIYTEPEWTTYDIRPPDYLPWIGAWRNADASVFIFLCEDVSDGQTDPRFRVYVTGLQPDVERVGSVVTRLKSILDKIDRRELSGRIAEKNLDTEHRLATTKRMASFVGLFTLAVNALSLYLRDLPPPELQQAWLIDLYTASIVVVHFLALLLLALVILLVIAYVIRYGTMLLRRYTS